MVKRLECELSGTAIVVDDDHASVSLLAEFLTIKGIKVVGKGYSGKDAVELYQSLRPDFVFLDIMMPHFGGLYALEKIKNMNMNARVIVIPADISSTTAEEIDRFKVPYIYKPYDFEEVVKITKNWSDHKKDPDL